MYDYFLSEVDTLNGKILVFSDSHGYSNYMNKALEIHDDADMMIHLGDGAYDLSHLFPEHPQLPLIFIAGNGEEGGWIRVDRKHEPLKFGFTEFAGDNVEFHASGCVTFPILGTKAQLADKLVFDPDRSRRRPLLPIVQAANPEYNVFVGGTSSFDMTPREYDKYQALDRYCKEYGYAHDEVLFVGDDFGAGGNDESVYVSDIAFLPITDYRTFPEFMKQFL
jgi:hypothetical protein